MAKYYLNIIVLLMVNNANALFIGVQTLDVVKGATVKTYDSVVYGISKIKCAEACLRKGRDEKCNLAGYHKVSRTCFLSLDDRSSVISVSDIDNLVIDTGTDSTITQWAQTVIQFSSQQSFVDGSWSANQLLGVANVYPSYGENDSAWCPSDWNYPEFIELQFALSVHVTAVNVYETYGGGSILRIKCFESSSGQYTELWSTNQTEILTSARIFSPELIGSCFSNQILLESHGNGEDWSEIDAVLLHGYQ